MQIITLPFGMSQPTSSSPSLSEEAALHAWDRTDWFCHCNIHDKSRMKHSQLMRPDRGIDARPTLILPFGMSQSPRFYWTSHPKYLYFSPRIIIVILEITNLCAKNSPYHERSQQVPFCGVSDIRVSQIICD